MVSYLYLHIPFCKKKCIYCDFLSVPFDASFARTYIEALCLELNLRRNSAGVLRSIYIGGGTPTLVSEDDFSLLFSCLRDSYDISPSAEITVEGNPGTVDDAKVHTLLSLGVNRLSLGVQSFRDSELSLLGRIHTSDDAVRAVNTARKAGLGSISLDLLYGVPQQTLPSWRESLSRAVGLSPDHIAAYELTPEKNTAFYRSLASYQPFLSSEETVISMYDQAIDYLNASGFGQYEISNFARPGHRCMHNINYWERGEYIGAGAGAHSFADGIRSRNSDDLERYVALLKQGGHPWTESENITHQDACREFIFLGLRKTEGISIPDAESLGMNIIEASRELVNDEYLLISGNRLSLTRKGIFVSNTVFVKLFEKIGLF